jgi:hypothetical protein
VLDVERRRINKVRMAKNVATEDTEGASTTHGEHGNVSVKTP